MKKISEWVVKNRNKTWFALVLNLLILFTMVLFMKPRGETDDDTAIRTLINGVRGESNPRLVYQNYFLGIIYQSLYGVSDRIPWYTVVQYVLLLCAFTTVTYVILQRIEKWNGIFLSSLLLIYFGFECYIRIQYTKTAGVLTGAGIFLIFYSITKEKICWKALGMGWFLSCFGAFYRFPQFLACAALMTGIGLCLILELSQFKKMQCLKRLGRYVGSFGILGILVIGFYIADTTAYKDDPLWEYYKEFNELRTELLDYGFPDYDQNEALYQELGIDRNAWRLYKSWNFNDPDKFTLEVMQALVDAKPQETLSKTHVKEFFKMFPLNFFKTRTFLCFLFVAVFWLIWGIHKKQVVASLFYEMVLFGGIYFYLFYKGRYLYNRVDMGFWFVLCLVVIWFLEGKERKVFTSVTGILCVVVLVISQKTWSQDWWINNQKFLNKRENNRARLEKIGQDKEHLYLIKMGGVYIGDSYGPFDDMPQGLLDNVSWLGGWVANTEVCQKVLENYGVTNPYRDMIGNDKIYLIDKSIDRTMEYLRTYYDKDAEAKIVGKYGKQKIYQIVSGEDQ